MPREHDRAHRIADRIHRDLALIIQRELADPRLKLLTINEVKVSRDQAWADVYYTSLNDDDPTEALTAAAGFLRSELSRVLATRVTPRLRFHYDHTLENGIRLTNAIKAAVARDVSTGDE